MPSNKLLIMAGGTGGHVFPGLAVADYLSQKHWQIDWMGTADKMEATLVPKHGYNIHFIGIGGVRGKSLVTKLLAPFKLLRAVYQALSIMRKVKPNVVLGMGGFASGPGGIAAKLLGIPLVIHEQNAIFGLTNRYLAKIANAVLSGFALTNPVIAKAPKNTKHVGNPIRAEFFEASEKQLAESTSEVNILVVGGSLGALAINQALPSIFKQLSDNATINVIHQAGKGKCEALINDYAEQSFAKVQEFIDDMPAAFAWADIIICRAGALTVSEVAGAGRAAIFVPLPIAVDDHQRYNAKTLADNNAALIIDQKDLNEELYPALLSLCQNLDKRLELSKWAKSFAPVNASQKVAEVIESFAPQEMLEEQA